MQPQPPSPIIVKNPLDADRILNERYRLKKILGQGSFGAAFLADDIKLGRTCVVKQMLLPSGRSTQTMSLHYGNFEREAGLLAQLNSPGHPNIPEIYDYFTDVQGTYLVMKYIEGQNLETMLKPDGTKIAWPDAARYAIAVCSAVHYMHTCGPEPIIHRDIKPANILLGRDERVWLVDFGLAKAKPIAGSGDLMATQSSGSIGYSPFEQWLGEAVPASDVYAVGATLHHLVTGLHPAREFGDLFDFDKLNDLHAQFVPLRQVDDSLPQALEDIVLAAVADDPVLRPAPLQLQRELEALVSGPKPEVLFTFKDGQTAKSNKDLVSLCQQHAVEAGDYLYNGDFERWFRLINRNDLAEAAKHAAAENPEDRKRGLKRFYRLILPNLFWLYLRRFIRRVVGIAMTVSLIGAMVTALVTISAVYSSSFALQQAIQAHEWPLDSLDFAAPNIISEERLNAQVSALLAQERDLTVDINLDMQPPSQIIVTVDGAKLPILGLLSLEDGLPHLYLVGGENEWLFWLNGSLSRGINRGIEQTFQEAGVRVTGLTVDDGEISFTVKREPGIKH